MTTTMPKPTTGDRALDAAIRAGFRIVQHRPIHPRSYYLHGLAHIDGRALEIRTELGTGRLISAQGRNRTFWPTTRLAARTVPAVERLVNQTRRVAS